MPVWLSRPDNVLDLQTDNAYFYLAGMMILNGMVDASQCPNGGLQNSRGTVANACGFGVAFEKVQSWQNNFDETILNVSRNGGAPAYILKGIFNQESQFWIGSYNNKSEFGLGHITYQGADALLLWNPGYYDSLCQKTLNKDVCAQGYGNLDQGSQSLLRYAALRDVNAFSGGFVDIAKAQKSVDTFSRALLANCVQTGLTIQNTLGRNEIAGGFSYDDLWRLNLLTYNAGAGCLRDALDAISTKGLPWTWDSVINHLEPGCQNAKIYIDNTLNVWNIN